MPDVQYIVLKRGKIPVGEPMADYQKAMQKAYDLLIVLDLKRLSKQQIQELSYNIVEQPC